MKSIHTTTRAIGGLICTLAVFHSLQLRADASDTVFDLSTATIPEITAAMDARTITSVELVNLYLRRIQAYDKTSALSPAQPLNSVAVVSPDVLEDAAEADALRRQGTVRGSLHGIPFLAKWSFSIKDMAITGGATGWANLITLNDTWLVAKCRENGAVVMGHANMDTWASSAVSSTSQIKGTVRSSYLAGALPGGSSGGSGVSSGAYLTNFAFGGETGGSIRNPGDRNNLVAYKVSGGSISVNRIIPLTPERDVVGPLCRSAIDNATVRDVVGPLDPGDMWSPILPLLTDKRPVPEGGFVSAFNTYPSLAGVKIGIIGTYVGMTHPNPGPGATSNTTGVQPTSALTTALVQKAKLDMEAAGATVNYVFLDAPVDTSYNRGPGAPAHLSGANSTNVSAYSYRELIKSIVERPGDTYQTLASKVLATASLVTQISAAVRTAMYTGSPGSYVDGPAVGFNAPPGIAHYTAHAQEKNAFETWMDTNGLDVVVWPMWPNKTATGGTIIGRDLVNAMYLPGVTVPMGILQYSATPSNKEGLTMDFTGRLYDDAKVLAIAHAYEQATHHRYSPPLAPPLPGDTFAYADHAPTVTGDDLPPVLTLAPSATKTGPTLYFTGNVADQSGVNRLEVCVGGILLPTAVANNKWTAAVSAANYATLVSTKATKVADVLVLAVDPAGNASSVMSTVNVDDTAPVFSYLYATPNTLGIPAGQTVPVTVVTSVADAIDPAPVTKIISITCNQPLAVGDATITGPLTASLKSISTSPPGRVYTLTLESKDFSGNVSNATVSVTAAPIVGRPR